MPSNDAYAQYRRNLDDYNQSEQQEHERQQQAIEAFKRRERENAPGFKVPTWLVVLAAILVTAAGAYLFIVLAFSQKG